MRKFKRGMGMVLAVAIVLNAGNSISIAAESMNESIELEGISEQQNNAVNMLNYIRVLAYEAATSNSRIYLEELYSALHNNTNPDAVDSQTLDEVLSLLDTLESYRMTSVKRERVQYIYEQSQAQAIREAIPSPVGLLSLTSAYSNPKQLLSVIYMAVDSVSSYQSATSEADMEHIMQNWELEDEEAKILNNSRKDLYAYMVNMVTSYALDGSLALNEESVADFVKWKNDDSTLRKIQFFESKQDTYKAFGPYWLTLSQCYYENGDFEKCIQALESYEKLSVDIYRQDYELAKVLPKVIMAAAEVLEEKQYVDFADEYGQVILHNTKDSQWDLKYFVAEIYVDLYNKTGNVEFLQNAYDIVLNNANYLTDQQLEMNKVYLAKVEEVDVPDGATKIQKKDIKEYNKSMKKARKRELPPVSDALVINMDMLYSIATELNISESEKKRLDALFKDSNGILFLVEPLNNMFSFSEGNEDSLDKIKIDKDEIAIPARFATSTTEISVEVQGEEKTRFSDWTLKEVERGDEADINTFSAIYTSEEAGKYSYKDGEIVVVTIKTLKDSELEPQVFDFSVKRDKAIGVLDNFEWLDNASKWTDDIEFERVSE